MVAIVERIRNLWNKTTHEIQFDLSSLPSESPKIASAIRQHWGIENSLPKKQRGKYEPSARGTEQVTLVMKKKKYLCRDT